MILKYVGSCWHYLATACPQVASCQVAVLGNSDIIMGGTEWRGRGRGGGWEVELSGVGNLGPMGITKDHFERPGITQDYLGGILCGSSGQVQLQNKIRIR